MVGDIVRVRYTCTLTDSAKVVMSTKNVIGKPWVEFVLGIDQVRVRLGSVAFLLCCCSQVMNCAIVLCAQVLCVEQHITMYHWLNDENITVD